MKLELQNSASQVLAMTPQMEMSLKILEMNSLELSEYVQNLALENPAIEIDDISISKQSSRNSLNYDDLDDFSGRIASPNFNTLEEYVREQIVFECPADLRPVATYIAGFLDEDGYLRMSMEDMTDFYSAKVVEQAISFIQGLEPAGVGARNLIECLLLQLEDDDISRQIVLKYLDYLAKGRVAQLAKKLDVSGEEINRAVECIRRLNPKPGSGFGSTNMTPYIQPDIVVVRLNNEFRCLPYTKTQATFNLNMNYINQMRETGDKEVTEYINKKIKQVEWVKKCIASRGETLLNVAKEVVVRQDLFFREGPQYMSVLKMTEIAKNLSLHESSISRAVKNKYLQYAGEIYPLKQFFVQGVAASNGDSVSSYEVKFQIQSLIAKENKCEPLSDQKIADVLRTQGIELSRRTVAKYREQLRIPTSYYRG